jgi:hypothetical protein
MLQGNGGLNLGYGYPAQDSYPDYDPNSELFVPV